MKGLIEKVLNLLYGKPSVHAQGPYAENRWNEAQLYQSSILYKDPVPASELALPSDVQLIYGDSVGGFLVHDSLKIATLHSPKIFGLYQLTELHERPEMVYAMQHLPDVFFFMDASNVWYYGVGGGHLHVYDAELDEFDSLGPAESALVELIGQWESAGR